MKKYTCKLIPKNENAEAIEYDIELNETDKKPALWKIITACSIAASWVGLLIGLIAWCSVVNSNKTHIDQFTVMMQSLTVLIGLTIIAGAVVIAFLLKEPKNNAIENKIIERVVDTVADDCEKDSAAANEGKKKKGFQIKVTRL